MSTISDQSTPSPSAPKAAPRTCLYRGRACLEPRDTKSNGDLHRFCRKHRERYNQYQRESQKRKRQREAALADANAALSELKDVETLKEIDIEWLGEMDELEVFEELDDDLLEDVLSLLEP